MNGFSLDRVRTVSDRKIVTPGSWSLSPLSNQRFFSQISSPKMDVKPLYRIARVVVRESQDTNVVNTGGANQLKSVTSSLGLTMTLVKLEEPDEAAKAAIWPYQVTAEELIERQRKWQKFSYEQHMERMRLWIWEERNAYDN